MSTMPGNSHARIAAMSECSGDDWMEHEGITDYHHDRLVEVQNKWGSEES